MSREDLVHAYVDGQISRRVFVRRLVAAGVSLGAALAYAEMRPAAAHAGGYGGGDDHYGDDCHGGGRKKDKKDKKDKKKHW